MTLINNPKDTLSGLRFFGEMTASVSHEIKNCLAIMNENAGLVQDFVLMEQKGKPLDAARVGSIADKIVKQIHRADTIVKNLNGFAHSVDTPVKHVDITEVLALTLALGQRLAAGRGVSLAPVLGSEHIDIKTYPFFLMQLLWRCVDFAMTAVGDEKTVSIAPAQADVRVEIRFGGLQDIENRIQTEAFTETVGTLLEILGAELAAAKTQDAMVLGLPNTADSGD